MKAFMEVETTGKKVSTETTHQLMQKHFQPKEYCVPRQISNLFSRW